jgi:hypothetical protein
LTRGHWENWRQRKGVVELFPGLKASRGRSQYFADGRGGRFDSTRPLRARGMPYRFVTSIFRRRCMMEWGLISPDGSWRWTAKFRWRLIPWFRLGERPAIRTTFTPDFCIEKS